MTPRDRHSMLLFMVAMALSLLADTPLMAEEPDRWKGDVELSLLDQGGNTDVTTFGFGAKGELALESSRIKAEGQVAYSEQEGTSTSRSWMVKGQYDWNLSERLSLFVSERLERNTLKGVEHRSTTQAGVGYALIKTDSDTLRGELSAGYVDERLNRPHPTLPGSTITDDNGYYAARTAVEYVHTLTEKTRVEQTVEYVPSLDDADDFILNEETALITNLFGRLALKLSFAVAYDNLPPPDFQRIDRTLKSSFLLTF